MKIVSQSKKLPAPIRTNMSSGGLGIQIFKISPAVSPLTPFFSQLIIGVHDI